MNLNFEFFISSVTLGQVLFCCFLFGMRLANRPTYFPLLLFFAANLVLVSGPILLSLSPQYYIWYIAAIFPAWLTLAPTLWLYVKGLTAAHPWAMTYKDVLHLGPVLFGIILAVAILFLPTETQSAIFFDDQDVDSGLPLLVVMGMFFSMIFWIGQSSFYVYRITKRLIEYRKILKDLFASNEKREMIWLSWLLIVICISWALSATNLILTLSAGQTLFSATSGALLMLILLWTMGYCGLRQKPGFDGRYLRDEPDNELRVKEAAEANGGNKTKPESAPTAGQKYQRSVLGKAQSERIVEKLTIAMSEQHLYLDSDLTLHKLARRLMVSPNYLSQTINETLESNFFDFINEWRIRHALPDVLTGEQPIIAIATDCGFNARSSFYKMFKKVTGMTPTQFRNQPQQFHKDVR